MTTTTNLRKANGKNEKTTRKTKIQREKRKKKNLIKEQKITPKKGQKKTTKTAELKIFVVRLTALRNI